MAAIVAAGHEVGNHMCRDEPSWRLPPRAFAAQAARVEALLAPHRAQPPPRRWFRRVHAFRAAMRVPCVTPAAFARPGHGVFRPHMLRTLRALGLTAALGDAYGRVTDALRVLGVAC